MSEEEFKRFYVLLAGRVYAFALRRVRSGSANDVVAETFATAWSKLSEAPRDPEAFTGWVFGIARYKVIEEVQRVTRKHHDNRFIADFELHQLQVPDAAEVVADREIGERIYASLSGSERELFDLLFILGATREQVCGLLQVSAGALDTRVSRLRDRIEKLEVLHSGVQPEVEHG